MTNDLETAFACIDRIREVGRGTSRSDRGLKLAVDTLIRARTAIPTDLELHDAIKMYSNMQNEQCSLVEREARRAASKGIRFKAVCRSSGEECQRECVIDVNNLSEPLDRTFFSPPKVDPLKLQILRITDTFSSNFQLVEGSVQPAPSTIADDGSSLSWQDRDVISREYRLELRPLEAGEWPLSEAPAHASFEDEEGGKGTFEFEIPVISVLPAVIEPTPTPLRTTSTPSVTIAPTQVPTAKVGEVPDSRVFLPNVSLH